MLILGTHMSIAHGLGKTADNALKMQANTMQIFSRNPRGSNFRKSIFKRYGQRIIGDRFWLTLHIR